MCWYRPSWRERLHISVCGYRDAISQARVRDVRCLPLSAGHGQAPGPMPGARSVFGWGNTGPGVGVSFSGANGAQRAKMLALHVQAVPCVPRSRRHPLGVGHIASLAAGANRDRGRSSGEARDSELHAPRCAPVPGTVCGRLLDRMALPGTRCSERHGRESLISWYPAGKLHVRREENRRSTARNNMISQMI